jgi:hypothetical protein
METAILTKPEFIETAIGILDRAGANPGYTLTVTEQFVLQKYAAYCVHQFAPETGSIAPRFYSQKETCIMIHCTEPTIIEWRKRGWIKPLHVGAKILYTDEIIQEALKTVSVHKYRK